MVSRGNLVGGLHLLFGEKLGAVNLTFLPPWQQNLESAQLGVSQRDAQQRRLINQLFHSFPFI